jgi:pyruvate dehydrogenase E1 component alpha subunit/2-oxoisovalerate dehydrogenase E1 component alpha subunit
MVSHLGAMISTCAGTLLARKLRGESGTVGLVTIGDGGTSTGSFHEGVNLAAVEKLPLVVVVANNLYAYSTPNSRQFACANLVDKAVGYGVTGISVAGNDLSACLTTIRDAVENARSGNGPQLIVATLLRLGGHGEHDDAYYIDPVLKNSPIGRDCIDVAEQQVLQSALARPSDIAQWRADAEETVEKTLAMVQREPHPDASDENWAPLSSPNWREGYFGY